MSHCKEPSTSPIWPDAGVKVSRLALSVKPEDCLQERKWLEQLFHAGVPLLHILHGITAACRRSPQLHAVVKWEPTQRLAQDIKWCKRSNSPATVMQVNFQTYNLEPATDPFYEFSLPEPRIDTYLVVFRLQRYPDCQRTTQMCCAYLPWISPDLQPLRSAG